MRRSLSLTLLVLLSLVTSAAARQSADEPAETLTAFVGAQVLTMLGDDAASSLLDDATVLVRGDRIVAVGPSAEIEVPEGAQRIDGTGRWLMPGLVDAHVHIWYADELLLYVANGVTSVRNMWGSPTQLEFARRIEAGELVGPSILTSGPIMDGSPTIWNGSAIADTAEEASLLVAQQDADGYSFLKVYDRLPQEAYETLVAEATVRGLPVCGHVPAAVGWRNAIAAGQRSIEHLSGLQEFLNPEAPPTQAQLGALANDMRAAGTWNCPTLVVYTKFVPAEQSRAWLELPEMDYVLPTTKAGWDPSLDFRLKDKTPEDFARFARGHGRRLALVRALHEAGAGLMLGTDAPNPFVMPGFSVHEEAAFLSEAGLDNYAVLLAATRNPAEAHELEEEFGTLAAGRRADLLLLDANPLEDLAALKQRSGVMTAGRWHTEAELQAQMEELATRLSGSADFLAELPEPKSLGGLLAVWEVSFNDSRLAMERAALSPDARQAFTQLAYDPTFEFSVSFDQRRLNEVDETTRVQIDKGTQRGEAVFERAGGRLRVRGTGLYAGLELERELEDSVLLSFPSLSTESRLWEHLEPLQKGGVKVLQRLSVDVSERIQMRDTEVVVRRLEDRRIEAGIGGRTARVYELSSRDLAGNGSVVSELWIDITTGRPLGLEQREQTGVIRALRLR